MTYSTEFVLFMCIIGSIGISVIAVSILPIMSLLGYIEERKYKKKLLKGGVN